MHEFFCAWAQAFLKPEPAKASPWEMCYDISNDVTLANCPSLAIRHSGDAVKIKQKTSGYDPIAGYTVDVPAVGLRV